MARDYATLRTDLWGDSDWRSLSRGAQWLYMYLLSVPSLTYVGVADWRPNRIAGVVAGESAETVRAYADELRHRRFIWTDEDKEEVVIRSFLRHDGLLLNPNLWKSVKKDFADVASEQIRRLIAHEANRLRSESPNGITTPKGKMVNPWESVHLETMLDTPCETPWDTPSHTPYDTPSPRGSDTPSGTGSPPAPAPAPSSKEDRGPQKSTIAIRLPDSWVPTKTHWDYVAEHGLDLEHEIQQFRAHAEANDRKQKNWNAAFTQWLGKSKNWAKPKQPAAQQSRSWMDSWAEG